jgi:ribosomal protein S12 methylthiotransferase
MARLLRRMGHQPVAEPGQAQVLVVNTCGFIEDAREESLDELRQLARQKRGDQVLIAAGCLAQRWGEALMEQVPGLDALLGTRRWAEIDSLVQDLRAERNRRRPGPLHRLDDPLPAGSGENQRFAQQGASAYLKIADGCSAPCAFCAIPLIKGAARSRPVEDIVQDAVELVSQGTVEIILIAQDTTAYGRDRGEQDALPHLVQAILDTTSLDATSGGPANGTGTGLRWLRLMYAYPGHVSPRLLEVMANDQRVCRYLDLPLQHAHPDTLRRMRRPANMDRTRRLLADLRDAMPDAALRTSFIVGYPGETDAEFDTLLDFVSEIRFDRVGGFLYSPEEGTAAAVLSHSVPEEVKVERLERLMALQQQVSLDINQAQVGRTLDVLIEGQGDGLAIGRSYRDAPEIDGLVLIPDGQGVPDVGSMVPVRITAAMDYDLVGEAADVTRKLPA